MEFEWNRGNREKNWVEHGVSAEETEQCFFNPALQFDDLKHSQREPRRVVLGVTDVGRLLTIVYTVRAGHIRVISARSMSRKERILYAAYQEKAGSPV